MLDTGFEISTDELTKLEVEMVNLIKSCVNRKKMKSDQKLKQQLQSV